MKTSQGPASCRAPRIPALSKLRLYDAMRTARVSEETAPPASAVTVTRSRELAVRALRRTVNTTR